MPDLIPPVPEIHDSFSEIVTEGLPVVPPVDQEIVQTDVPNGGSSGYQKDSSKPKKQFRLGTLIGGVFLLIILPVFGYYFSTRTNITANLPFASDRITVKKIGATPTTPPGAIQSASGFKLKECKRRVCEPGGEGCEQEVIEYEHGFNKGDYNAASRTFNAVYHARSRTNTKIIGSGKGATGLLFVYKAETCWCPDPNDTNCSANCRPVSGLPGQSCSQDEFSRKQFVGNSASGFDYPISRSADQPYDCGSFKLTFYMTGACGTQAQCACFDCTGCTVTDTITYTTGKTCTPPNTITSTPTQTPSHTPSHTPSITHTPTNSPSITSTPSVTNTPSNTPTGTPSITPTETPTNTPTSTLTPTPGICEAMCTSDASCQNGLLCSNISGNLRCRNPQCPLQNTCVCGVTATPAPTRIVQVVEQQVITATPVPAPVVVVATPTPTPRLPVSGAPTIMGAATVVGGIVLLILGLIL